MAANASNKLVSRPVMARPSSSAARRAENVKGLAAAMQGCSLVSATAPDVVPAGSAASAARRLARALVEGARP